MMIREARTLLEGGMGIAEAAEALREWRKALRTAFSVDDMEALRRSGRLGNVKMSISTILNIKPLLKITDGSIVSAGIARGQSEQIKKLIQFLDVKDGQLMVEQFLGLKTAESVAQMLQAQGYQVRLRRVGPVLGVHLGHGAVGVHWVSDETV